jgi:hypothetical protein
MHDEILSSPARIAEAGFLLADSRTLLPWEDKADGLRRERDRLAAQVRDERAAGHQEIAEAQRIKDLAVRRVSQLEDQYDRDPRHDGETERELVAAVQREASAKRVLKATEESVERREHDLQVKERKIVDLNLKIGDIEAAAQVDALAGDYDELVERVQELVALYAGMQGRRQRVIREQVAGGLAALGRLDNEIALAGPRGAIELAYTAVGNLHQALERRALSDSRPQAILAPRVQP